MSRVTQASDSGQTKSAVGPLKWMSVEALKDKKYSTKSDVWSFGIFCWEVLNNSDPFPDLDAFQAAAKVAYEGLRVELPSEEKWPVLHEVMSGCFNDDPDTRPSMNKICQMMEQEK